MSKFRFAGSGWVDDYSGPDEGYTGIYSYKIHQDGIVAVEVDDSASPMISDIIDAPAETKFSISFRNGNSQIPIGNPNRYGPWGGPYDAHPKGQPTPITAYSFNVIRED